ncbi:MAG TPA: AMP-binding protein [Terrimicrobiaceae bacterium]|nr:AMP-binding protein [Terrimicrobiaceae bacterium]
MPRQALRELQAKQLRAFLRDVVLPFHSYYRDLFCRHGVDWRAIKSLDDLQEIPFTIKKDLAGGAEKTREFVIAPDPRQLARRPSTILRGLVSGVSRTRRQLDREFRPIFMTSTTGRSADPVPFVYTAHDLAALRTAGFRLMQLAGGSTTDRMLNMFPFAPHLAFWQTHYAGTAFGVFILSSGGGKTIGTDGNIRMLRKLNPDVLIGMPTFVYHVLREAALDGVRCDKLRGIVLGGEKVPQGLRRKLQECASQLEARDISVISTYGFTEAKMAWCECLFPVGAEPSGYHLYPDLGIVEVIDPETGAPREDGQPGEIVYTSLDARGSAVLRYRTGDIIEGGLTYEPCPYCRRTMPRLLGRISRRSDFREMQLDKVKGTLVDFNELEHVLDDMPYVGSWQIELCKANDDPMEVDELVLHVCLADGGEESSISKEIKRALFARVELHPNRIEFHSDAEMRQLQGVGEKLKEQKVVDRRSKIETSQLSKTTN